MRIRIFALSLIVVAVMVAVKTTSTSTIVDKKSTINAEREKGPRPDRPGEAAQFWQDRLTSPGSTNPALLNFQIKQELARNKRDGHIPAYGFESFGPGNFGGRLRSIIIHQNEPNQMLVGCVSGGVWKSTDGGNHWQPKSDFLSSIAISSMVVDPDQHNRVFIGTGEGFFNTDAARGLGIFVSEDFGETWEHLTATANGEFYYINRLARIPGSDTLMAATRTGLFRSIDLGLNWNRVDGFLVDSRGFVDLKVDPSNGQRLYAYHYGSAAAGSATTVTVNSPASLAGTVLESAPASFGPSIGQVGSVSGNLILTDPVLGCGAFTNASALAGNIALIDRGSCNFTVKVKNAQDAGAIAAIVVNNEEGAPTTMGGTDASVQIPSVMISLANGNTIKAALSQGVSVTIGASNLAQRFLARSVDAGQTWVALGASNGLPASDISRMEIGIGSDGVVYVAVANDNTDPSTRGLWKSTDGGNSFAKTGSTTAFIERQGWYDLMIGVDPSDSERVYLGAVDTFRSINGGTSIDKITFWNPGSGQIPHHVHADLHTIAFHPTDPNTFWIGTDGGIYKSTDGGDNFVSLNNDLRVAQNYGIAIHPNGDSVITGTQDNGSHLFFGDRSVWLEWAGGDGGFCAWDQQNPNFLYGSNPSGSMFGSTDGGNTLFGINLPDTTGAAFIQPFSLDPNNGNRMIVGTNKVYFAPNVRLTSGASWQSVSADFGTSVSATTISQHDGSFALAGTNAGKIYVNTDLGGSGFFTELTSLGDMSGIVTWLEIDRHDTSGQTFYATFSGYRADRIMKTEDGGSTWFSIHGDLPNLPVYCLSVDPLNPNQVFIGTELGLWVSVNNGGGGMSWAPYEYGPARTRIVQMKWANDRNEMWIATHGRGTYRMTRDGVVFDLSHVQVQGDGDRFIDLNETHQIDVVVRNDTQVDLTEAWLEITSSDPRLEISGGMQIGTLAGFTSQTLSFEAFLSELDLPLKEIELTATLHADNVTFSHKTTTLLGANPNLMIGNFSENAEQDGLMTHSSMIANDDWQRVITQFHMGTMSWFSANENAFADRSLETPPLTVVESNSTAEFYVYYHLEGNSQQYWDGAVLEVEVDGQWRDLGHAVSGATYDGQLHNNTSLYLRDAWSGLQTSWRKAEVSLAEFMNQEIRLRWRLACDESSSQQGFWVDSIQISGVSWELPPSADMEACSDCSSIKGSLLPFVYTIPHAVSGQNHETMIGAINGGQVAADIEVFAFDAFGRTLGSWNSNLAPLNSLWMPVSSVISQHEQVAWLQLGSTLEIDVMAEFQGPGTRSAYSASDSGVDEVFLPHVAKNTAVFETYLAMVNGSPEPSMTELVPSVDGSDPIDIGDGHGAYQKLQVTAASLLGDSISVTEWGVIRSAPAPISAMEYFTVLPGENQVASLGLTNEQGSTIRFSHIAKDTQIFWTGMVYINVGTSANEVTESYYSDSGEVISTRAMSLAPFEKVTLLLDENSGAAPVPAGAAWLEVTGSSNLIGYELFGAAFSGSHDFFSGLKGSHQAGQSLTYAHVEGSQNSWTGLVALNVGDETADLLFELIGQNGVVKASNNQADIPAKTKSTLLLQNLFPGVVIEDGDWVRATATASQWSGFALWGDQGTAIRQNLAGLNAFVH